MKRYAISWYDDFTMTLKMEITDAENDFEALKIAFRKQTRRNPEHARNISEIKALARACEGAIEAIEIYEPEYLPAFDVTKRFISGLAKTLPTKALPTYAH